MNCDKVTVAVIGAPSPPPSAVKVAILSPRHAGSRNGDRNENGNLEYYIFSPRGDLMSAAFWNKHKYA